MFNIVEKFLSIDGEGPSVGEIATFIRFQGCNLQCSWCDTKYSWKKESITERLSVEEIYGYIKSNGSRNVTLTGGEPLLQEGIGDLLEVLSKDKSLFIRIETNGAIKIDRFKKEYASNNISYVVDYKLPSSEMCTFMELSNFSSVEKNDVYKFVIADKNDLIIAHEIIEENSLTDRCLVYLSPIIEKISPEEIVEFMKEKRMNKVRLQLQLHKIIWDKNARGV